MLELSSEFKMFLGRGMYKECSKLVLIEIKKLLILKINKQEKTYYSDNFSEILNKYLQFYPEKKSTLEEILSLEDESSEEQDQVERLSRLMQIQTELEESI